MGGAAYYDCQKEIKKERDINEGIVENAQFVEVLSADSSRKDTLVVVPLSAVKDFRARALPMIEEGKITVVKQDKVDFQP